MRTRLYSLDHLEVYRQLFFTAREPHYPVGEALPHEEHEVDLVHGQGGVVVQREHGGRGVVSAVRETGGRSAVGGGNEVEVESSPRNTIIMIHHFIL